MSSAIIFHHLFRDVLARQVEYSYSAEEDSFTTMIPLQMNLMSRVIELANVIPFAGDWAWSVKRFASIINPDAFLFRLDWRHDEPTAVTLYCRFPSEPDTAGFMRAIGYARPFQWNGPDTSSVATSLGVQGPRGVAFRATHKGNLRTAVYFRSEQHSGVSWANRLPEVLAACGYSEELTSMIVGHLKDLYTPGPVGIIGVDDGNGGVAGALKFDPSNVPVGIVLQFLARIGVSATRIATLKNIAVGLRAEATTYVGVQYTQQGLSGWRLYFACEPFCLHIPGQAKLSSQRNLRPVRRLPHY